MTRTCAEIERDRPQPTDQDVSARSPLRRCLASGAVRPRGELLRFVVGPDGRVLFDGSAKLPGRGLWLSPERALVERAAARGLFARGAKRPVEVPSDLAGQAESHLEASVLGLLGLARRAGLVTLGFEKARAGLSSGKVRLLLQAADGAAGGRDKLRALADKGAAQVAVIELFSVAQLSAALGRDNAVHVAVAPGGLAERIAAEVGRLRGMRPAEPQARGIEA